MPHWGALGDSRHERRYRDASDIVNEMYLAAVEKRLPAELTRAIPRGGPRIVGHWPWNPPRCGELLLK